MVSYKKINVLYVIDSLGFGGAERQLVELVRGLDRNKYVTHICCLFKVDAGYDSVLNDLRINLFYFQRRYKFDISPAFKLAHYILKNDIHIVHTFMSMGGLMGIIAGKLTRRPTIAATIRDARNETYWLHILNRKMQSFLANNFVSNSLAGFENRYKRLKPHFRVVYNGIDFTRFGNQNPHLSVKPTDLGLDGFYPVIGMVARLSNHKDHDTLLAAIPFLVADYPNVGFLLVGDGPERHRLEHLVQEIGFCDHVVFAGFRHDIEEIYPLMDVSVLLTSISIKEGISNSLLEAMASGVPVIASAGGGTDELISHGINGMLVTPANPKLLAEAIIQILSSKKKAQAMSINALNDIKLRFSLDRYVKEYVSIYQDLLNPSN